MQSKLYTLFLFAFLITTLGSCRKWLPENRLEGSWQLTELQKRRPLNNENVPSAYQSGTFTFLEDRTARYTDAGTIMQGSWEIRSVSNSYIDREGNRQTETKNVLWIKLYDFSSNRVIDWYFDRFDFRSSGQRLFAFMDGSGYDYRYCFSKR
nr:hypothetical protein [uncultured Lacibacter sp.]